LAKESQARLAPMLGKVSLFKGLKDKQLKKIAASGKELVYTPGQVKVEEGAFGVGFYLILEGTVEVRKGKKSLAQLKAGDFFGEMSLFDEQPRSASVSAVTETRCLGITSWSFIGMVKSDPDIAVNMMKEMAVRLRRTDKALAE
jgi:CRP/FNR family cyclic AMP-dependent transcriptional regulator